MIARILQGTPANQIPVERPTSLKLAINAGALRVMGLTAPPALLQRADEVVE
jgi:putative ABC transport system substrate-binding protein